MGSARLAPVGVVVFVPAGLVVAAHVYVLWRRKRGNERSSITENNPAFRVDNGGCGCGCGVCFLGLYSLGALVYIGYPFFGGIKTKKILPEFVSKWSTHPSLS